MKKAVAERDRLKAELAEANGKLNLMIGEHGKLEVKLANEKARYAKLRYRAMGVHECLACGSVEWECTCGKAGEP